MSPLTPPRNQKLSVAATVVALLSGAVFILALAQAESGRYFSKTVSLESALKKAEASGEFGYRLTLPKRFRDDPRVAEQAMVLEDGEPLPLKIEKIKHVSEKGRGRYRITQRTIYLSPPDNSDPRENGRRYELQAPRTLRPPVFWLPLALLAAAMFYLQRYGAPTLPNWHAHPWVEPGLVLAASFGTMFWALGHFSAHSDGWLIVNGTPFSDGQGWVELGKSLAEGRGFSGPFEAHRGGYPILLGGFFSLTGTSSVLVAKLFNALMLALGATAIYCLVRSAFGRGLAVVTLAGLLLGTRFGVLAQMTLTEPTGFALAAIGLHQLYRACQHPALWRFLIVGVFLGLSNLVRPFTLLALPLFGAIILWIAWRDRWGWRRFATLGAAYVGGAMLILAPWMLRQKLTWGVTTIDLNSAVMIYGAAAPPGEGEKRMLAARHYEDGDRAGIPRGEHGARYHFFMGRYKEIVAADPGGYFAFVAGRLVDFFTLPGFADGHVRQQLGVVFFLACTWLAWRRRIPPLVLLAGGWPLIADGLGACPAALVVTIATALGFAFNPGRARLAIAILAATLAGAGILNALVGNFALNRGTVFIEWIVVLLVSAGILGLARLAAGGVDQTPAGTEPTGGRFSDAYPLAVLGVLVAAMLALVIRAGVTRSPDLDAWAIPAGIASEARSEIGERHPAVPGDELFVGRVQLGEYRWLIRHDQDLGHWARTFEPRPFERTVAMPLAGYHEGSLMSRTLTVNLPGDQLGLDGSRDFLLVGMRNLDEQAELGHGKLIIEALALIPYNPASPELDTGAAIYFQPPPDL